MRMVFVLAMRVASYRCVKQPFDFLLDEQSVEQRPDRRRAPGRETRAAGLEPERHLDIPSAAHRHEARMLGIGFGSVRPGRGRWPGVGARRGGDRAHDDDT